MSDQYRDILISADDITLDHAGGPIYVTGLASIAQDIKHLIRETGLLVGMIGQRDDISIAESTLQLVVAVEDEHRIIPGTVEIVRTSIDTLYLTAKTVLGDVELRLKME